MESSGKARSLIGKLFLLGLLGAVGWAALAQYQSTTVRTLTQKADDTLYVAILTQPAMVAAYNPSSHKSIWTTIKRRKLPEKPFENAQDLLKQAQVPTLSVRYYIPKTLKRDEFWEQFKNHLTQWRYNPILAGQLLWDYLQAYHDKRTNLSPAEFLAYAMDMSRLELTDITIKNVEEKTKKKSSKSTPAVEPDRILAPVEDKAPLALEDRPLLLEILNASGKKGAAMELTQYLRDKTQQGLLSVDVLQYDTFHGEHQAQTHIIDYTGRRNQLKQLSSAMGLNNEIISEKQDTAICDARIIIGEDYKQPL